MSTPRDDRAKAREQSKHLQIIANRHERIRSRSTSPAPARRDDPPPPKRSAEEVEEEQFRDALSYDQTAMVTPEQLAILREQLRNELRMEVRNELRHETAAAAAAIPDSIRKKPEIPPFDKAHVDIWVKRTENAFIRANIRAVNEKFAFLETKFPVGFNPTIDEYLYGNATDDTWTSFITYLKKEYGTTKQQRASIFIDGFRRDGRRPTQFAAALDEKTKDVTIDEIKKEMLLREMPMDVRRMLQERIEGCSFKEAAEIADNYFDAEGRPKHISQNPTVNQISRSTSKACIPDPTSTTDDEEPDTNAVSIRKKHFKKRSNGRGQPDPTASQQTRPAPTPQPVNRDSRTSATPKQNKLCKYHELWGDAARTCKQGCPRFPKMPSNGKAGRQA